MEQHNNDLSKAMGQLSVSADDSDETSTPPKNLGDMPVDIGYLIIERSDYKEQLILRKVSKTLRELVDKLKPSLKTLEFTSQPGQLLINFDSERLVYTQIDADNSDDSADESDIPSNDFINRKIASADYEKIAFDDLASTLKNPKLQLEEFAVAFHDVFTFRHRYRSLSQILQSIDSVSSRSFQFYVRSPEHYCSILPYLKPGYLEKICCSVLDDVNELDDMTSMDTLNEIALLDQWNQAKELHLKTPFNINVGRNFQRYVLEERSMNAASLIRIRDFLSSAPNFEFCLIRTRVPFIERVLCEAVGYMVANNERTKYVSHYSIPDSDDYLEFLFFEKSIEIRKVHRT